MSSNERYPQINCCFTGIVDTVWGIVTT